MLHMKVFHLLFSNYSRLLFEYCIYSGLSLFSLVGLPFSLKLLWAPFVDSCYFQSIGRRKSWLIPIQLLTGLVMIFGSGSINYWLGDALPKTDGVDDNGPNVQILTIFFFFLYFLMATQDIAVDGWALTMLSREHVGYASTCNSIGQAFGVFLANQGYIALSDPHWCQRFLGMTNGQVLVSLQGFMVYWGWVFIVVTILVGWFKKETSGHAEEDIHNLYDTYKQVVAIFKLKPVQLLTVMLLTSKVGFTAADAVSNYKMQEYGMPKTDIASISPILMVIGLMLPVFLGHKVSARPIEILIPSIKFKLFTSVLLWLVTMNVKYAYHSNKLGSSPGYGFYILLIAVLSAHEIASTLIFLSCISFYAKVSDPLIGGTYMTLLNTISNLGYKWPQATILWLLPKVTTTMCESVSTGIEIMLPANQICSVQHDKSSCHALGGHCKVLLDGYTIETGLCLMLGLLWLYHFGEKFSDLQHLPHSDWSVSASSRPSTDSIISKVA